MFAVAYADEVFTYVSTVLSDCKELVFIEIICAFSVLLLVALVVIKPDVVDIVDCAEAAFAKNVTEFNLFSNISN